MSQNSNVSVANGGFLAQKDAQNYVKSAFVLKFLAFASRMEHKNANEFEPSYVDYVEFDTDLRKVALHCRSIFLGAESYETFLKKQNESLNFFIMKIEKNLILFYDSQKIPYQPP